MDLFDIEPIDFETALRRAVDEDPELRRRRSSDRAAADAA
jgi:hypothetical protein